MKRIWPLLTSLLMCAAVAKGALYSVGLEKSYFTSDFMIGSVVVAVIFPESDGSFDLNSESWSDQRKSQAMAAIMSGLGWWANQNPKAHVSFTYVSQTVPTKYEPIRRPYYDESLWIPDIMSKLGFPGNRFSATKNYVNFLRDKYKTDWGYVIFVVDSLNDYNGKFADGFFAYAYLGGPFMVMTYTNGGYGIANMDVVAAHESGHIFQALDEYAGASSPYDYSEGYFPTINGNHAWSPTANDPNSIMRGGIRWGLDNWARQMIGWRDQNNNGHEDIVDMPPQVDLLQGPQSISTGTVEFSGLAKVKVLPRQGNAGGNGFTVDSIVGVQFSLSGENWRDATPVNGKFSNAEEPFSLEIPKPEMGLSGVNTQSIQVRAFTFFGRDVSDSAGGGGGGSAENLASAHAFPNPFKPNSKVGHNEITFSGLTPDSKIQIYSAAGEPVREIRADSSGHEIPWDAKDENGKKVASGVYFYLITDPSGGKKKGNLAIIR